MGEIIVEKRGRIVIPKVTRERLGLAPGTRLLLMEEQTAIVLLRRPERFTLALQGLGKHLWADVEGYLQNERGSWE